MAPLRSLVQALTPFMKLPEAPPLWEALLGKPVAAAGGLTSAGLPFPGMRITFTSGGAETLGAPGGPAVHGLEVSVHSPREVAPQARQAELRGPGPPWFPTVPGWL